MSKTPTHSISEHPLTLDFFEAGSFRREVKGWVHRKTVPYTILVQAVEGSYEIAAAGRHEIVATGRVMVVPAHTPIEFTHHDGPKGVLEARWVHLRFSLWGIVDVLGRYDLPLRLSEKESREIGSLIAKAVEADALPDELRLIRQHEIAAILLSALCRGRTPRADAQSGNARMDRFGTVLAHIKENLAAPLSAGALARLAGLSPARFYTVFRKEFGVTPMHYVRIARLELAARLLVATDLKLARVAEASGFSDAFHLSHVFKAHFDVSPRDYRKSAALVYS